MNDLFAVAAGELERRVDADEADENEFGVRVAPGVYERVENNTLISSVVCNTPGAGRVVYQIIGVSALNLI